MQAKVDKASEALIFLVTLRTQKSHSLQIVWKRAVNKS